MGQLKKIAAGAVLAGSVTVMTACSGGFGAGGDSGGDKKTGDPAKVGELVLPASEFPAGYQVQEVPKGPEMQQALDQARGTAADAQITPASCKQTSAIPADLNVDDIGMAYGTKGAEMATVTVTAQTGGLETQRKMHDDGCNDLSMKFESGALAGASGDVEQEIVDAPKTDADDALVVDADTEMSYQGQEVKSNARIGMAEVNGYTVAVQMQASQGEVDQASFDEFFTKAVNHVAEQTS